MKINEVEVGNVLLSSIGNVFSVTFGGSSSNNAEKSTMIGCCKLRDQF